MTVFADMEEAMGLMESWEDRYAYLIDMGRALPPYPDAGRIDAYLVPGCTSRVWMQHRWDKGRLILALESDAHIVKGLLAILYALYNNQTAQDILSMHIESKFDRLGLSAHLSPNRRSGFFAVASRIQSLARAQKN